MGRAKPEPVQICRDSASYTEGDFQVTQQHCPEPQAPPTKSRESALGHSLTPGQNEKRSTPPKTPQGQARERGRQLPCNAPSFESPVPHVVPQTPPGVTPGHRTRNTPEHRWVLALTPCPSPAALKKREFPSLIFCLPEHPQVGEWESEAAQLGAGWGRGQCRS